MVTVEVYKESTELKDKTNRTIGVWVIGDGGGWELTLRPTEGLRLVVCEPSHCSDSCVWNRDIRL